MQPTSRVRTGVAALDAVLLALSKAAGVELVVHCEGDVHIDDHHTAEDVAITLGQCLHEALGDKAGLARMACAEGEHGEAHEAGHGALLSWQAMAAKSGMIDLANWAVIYSSLSIHGTSVWLQSITSFPSFSLFFPPFLAIAKALALAFAFPLACACACAPSL